MYPDSVNVIVESRSGLLLDNEDRYLTVDDPPFYAVLDGQFHRGRAAEVALDVLRSRLPSLAATLPLGPDRVRDSLSAIVREVNEAIFVDAMNPRWRGCGTTLTGVALSSDSLVIAHVGDSRLYCRVDGAWHCVTTDHSLVQDARHAGWERDSLSELIANHSTVITRALGIAADVRVDTAVLPREAFQEVFLCSDGLWRPFDPNLNGAAPPNLTGKSVLDWAFEAYEKDGQADNATGLVVTL